MKGDTHCMNEKFKLGRMECESLQKLQKLTVKDGKIDKIEIPRQDVYSSMHSQTEYIKGERLLIPHKSDYYVYNQREWSKTDKEGKIFELAEDGNFYPIGWYSELIKDEEFIDKFMQLQKKAITLQKLSGHGEIETWEKRFQNGGIVNIIVKDGDVEYECARHNDFIRPLFGIYTPVINEQDEIVAIEVPFRNMVYRMSSVSQNAWVAIPKDRPYILQNINKDDENKGHCEMFVMGEQVGEPANSMEEFLSKNKGEIRNLVTGKAYDFFLDCAKCEIYVSSESED